ncbi:YwiC-like family protein [Neobacillus sp. NPDC093182]|uniref:YwiC-like family protein n=1 Tax=Neobacillus sp. NPDC093182 TaxID=3364297 RepID=UPI0038137DB2
MKLFLPKQHGAWAMTIIPFWLGVIDGGFLWQHIPFFIGWIFLYLATYPMLLLFKKKKIQFYKKWTIIYLVPALLFLLFPLLKMPSIIMFGLVMVPFFAMNAYYTSINKTMIREKMNLQFKWISWGYHTLLIIICLVFGCSILAIAFLPSIIRAIIFYGKPLSPMKIGIYEIINSAIFFTLMIIQIILFSLFYRSLENSLHNQFHSLDNLSHVS